MDHRGPRFFTQAYVVLRGDDGHLNARGVDRARWTGLAGRRVVIALINVRTWDPGLADRVGRILVDAGAVDVQFQAQADTAARFTAEADQGAADYLAVLNR